MYLKRLIFSYFLKTTLALCNKINEVLTLNPLSEIGRKKILRNTLTRLHDFAACAHKKREVPTILKVF